LLVFWVVEKCYPQPYPQKCLYRDILSRMFVVSGPPDMLMAP
jgi:hypothetical protein